MFQARLTPLRSARDGLDQLAQLRARQWDELSQLSFRLGVLLGQPPLIDATLRVFSADILPPAARRRFLFAGLDPDDVAGTLRAIRSIADWPRAWAVEARREEMRARAADAAGRPERAAVSWRNAALAYGFAQAAIGGGGMPERELEDARLAAFARAAPNLAPPAEPVTIPWPTAPLPAYLRRPPGPTGQPLAGPAPLVVLFNGAGFVKEEMTLWSEPFLACGLATLAFDGPGCGELRGRVALDRGQEDVTAAILGWAADRDGLDADRVALLGISFGGAQVIHHAARNPTVAACVSVTPPFHPPPYVDHVHPFVMAEIAALCGIDPSAACARAEELSCVPFVDEVRCPTLVVRAGLDAILPPAEAGRLYDALSCPKTLLSLRRATHVGLSHVDLWTAAAANWLATRL